MDNSIDTVNYKGDDEGTKYILVKNFRFIKFWEAVKVVFCLWPLPVLGSYCSSFALAYIGTICSITTPALYNRYEDLVDRYCGVMLRQIWRRYKIVDESIMSRLPRALSKDKET